VVQMSKTMLFLQYCSLEVTGPSVPSLPFQTAQPNESTSKPRCAIRQASTKSLRALHAWRANQLQANTAATPMARPRTPVARTRSKLGLAIEDAVNSPAFASLRAGGGSALLAHAH